MKTELVILSAADVPALIAAMQRVENFIDRVPDEPLMNVAYTCSLTSGPERVAVVVDSLGELRDRFKSVRSRLETGVSRIRDKSGTYYCAKHFLGDGGGKLAFVYPGVMSFYPDMLRDLAIVDPECRGAFDELEEALVGEGAFVPSSFIFPPAEYYRRDADVFSSGAYAQALVSTYSACVAMTRLLAVSGVAPDGVVGFADGDLAAIVGAGAAGEAPARPERLGMIREIYGIVDKAVDHSGLPHIVMLSVLLRREPEAAAKLEEILGGFPPGKVVRSIDFSPRQQTFCVAPDFAEAAIAAFAAAGIRSVRLEFDRPFNTPACEAVVPAIRRFADRWMKAEPRRQVYSCATAAPVDGNIRNARRETAERWSRPVRFAETIRRMHADGYRVFLEVGPRGLLSKSIEEILRGGDFAAVSMNSIHRRGCLHALHALAQLAAFGLDVRLMEYFTRRKARRIDLDSSFISDPRRETELKLSRRFPRMTLLGEAQLRSAGIMPEPTGRRGKVAEREAAKKRNDRARQQFDSGIVDVLVSDADVVAWEQGISLEIRKIFTLGAAPFLADFSIGANPPSYSDPKLQGMVVLSIPAALEIMAETALRVMPSHRLTMIEEFYGSNLEFNDGSLALAIRAEFASSSASGKVFLVQIREDKEGASFAKPAFQGKFLLAENYPDAKPVMVEPHSKPRAVHWSSRDVYPARLCVGKRLRTISSVEAWSESGLDYELTVPRRNDCVAITNLPVWRIDPLFIGAIVSGYQLWHSHERFPGAQSYPVRFRRLELRAPLPKENSSVRCYMRLAGVTKSTHLCDIEVSDGDGGSLLSINGWEEQIAHFSGPFRDIAMQPFTAFVSEPLPEFVLGEPAANHASAWITNIPYPIFATEGGIWQRTFAKVVLNHNERGVFAAKESTAHDRRTEWLFGRIVAKEAVRRFLKEKYQARWAYADVEIFPDKDGKPHPLGAWQDQLQEKIDVAIAHTAQFIVALAASNARVGIDVEINGRTLSEEFIYGVFMPEEIALATRAPNPTLAIIRFWCAKEAVSKALGSGIRWSPREMMINGYKSDLGEITVRLTGEWENNFRRFRGRDIAVSARTFHDHTVASCFIPAAMFDEYD